MQRFLVLVFVLLLYGCGGNNSSPDDPNAPPPFTLSKSTSSPVQALLYENTSTTSADFTITSTGDVTITGIVLKRITGSAFLDPNAQKLDLHYKVRPGSTVSENYFTYFVHGDEMIYKNLNMSIPANATVDLNFVFTLYKTLPDTGKTLQMGITEVSYKIGNGKVKVYTPTGDITSPLYTLSKAITDTTIPFVLSKNVSSPNEALLYENTSIMSTEFTMTSTRDVVITGMKFARIGGTAFLSPNVQKLDLYYKMPTSPWLTEDYFASFVNGDEMVYKDLNMNVPANTSVALNFIFTTLKDIPDVNKTLQMGITEVSYKIGNGTEQVFKPTDMVSPVYTLSKMPVDNTLPFTLTKSSSSPNTALLYDNTSTTSADFTMTSMSSVVITGMKFARIGGTAFLDPNAQKLDLHYKTLSGSLMDENYFTSFVNGDEMIYKNLNINLIANTTLDLNFIFTMYKTLPDINKTLQMGITEVSYKTGDGIEKVFKPVEMTSPLYTLSKTFTLQ